MFFSTYFPKNLTILRVEKYFDYKDHFQFILPLVEVNQAILAW